ncbi:MAG: hypothetical protein ACJ8FY_14150 [Gemmataceae bacterium]
MSHPPFQVDFRSRFKLVPWFVILPCALTWALEIRADEKNEKPREEKRSVVGKCFSPQGTLLAREKAGKAWNFVDKLGSVYSRDRLVTIPGERAVVVSKNNAARLLLVGNLPEFTSVPVLECAVMLHDKQGVDLDITLETGRVLVTNKKDEGPVKVHVAVGEESWDLVLDSPGSEILVEAWARWPQGMPFQKDPKFAATPTNVALFCVLQGSASFKTGSNQYGLTAPPGPAIFVHESDEAREGSPRRLNALPEALDPRNWNKPEMRRARDIAGRLEAEMMKKDIPTALTDLLNAADQTKDKDKVLAQEMLDQAVFTMGALDELGLLIDTLGSKVGPQRIAAVSALRQFIGREPRNDFVLYQYLIQNKKYSEIQAEILVGLLHSFGETDLSRPETYDTLIGYLRNERLPIRELALWHLVRVVPGKKIIFDPAGPPEEREKAVKEWKTLIPNGHLPPAPVEGQRK